MAACIDIPKKDELLEALNFNMNEEFRAVLQYICHRISARGEHPLLAESFKTAALDEMSHMLYFSDLITHYGGEPRFGEWKVDQSSNPHTMLEADLRLEQEARVRYTQQLQCFKALEDVAAVLTNALDDETEHEETFKRYREHLCP